MNPRSAAGIESLGRFQMRGVALVVVLLAAACGGNDPGEPQSRYTGTINTSAGSYSATLFVGGGYLGYFSTEAAGLSGALQGALPAVTIKPDRCATTFPATIVVHGETAEISYTNASCADAPSGSGTLRAY
jgi:hypothetical protein